MWRGLIQGLCLTASVGISDGLELYTNPQVHREHNCPDIMRMHWEDYTGFHAALSGIKCSWFLFLPFLTVFPIDNRTAVGLALTNIAIPLVMFVKREKDIYAGHKWLYLINFCTISSTFAPSWEATCCPSWDTSIAPFEAPERKASERKIFGLSIGRLSVDPFLRKIKVESISTSFFEFKKKTQRRCSSRSPQKPKRTRSS